MPEILHVELVEKTGTALELRLWRNHPNAAWTRVLPLAEIGGLVERAEADYYDAPPADLAELGRALFRWLDGGERRLSAEIEASANRADVLVLAVSSSSRLAHLPWEALHDGAGFLVHAGNPPVLPVRWRPSGPAAHMPANRPLRALFMASSPTDGPPLLDFEWEESEMVEATRRWPMEMVVEESGSLDELAARMRAHGDAFFDLLHLTGHARHEDDGTPVFLLEDGEGRCAPAAPLTLARGLPYRPPLVFLSGCLTGRRPMSGEVRSMAEQLIEQGFRAVLGWGRSVLDAHATRAARHLYEHLAAGEPLPLALVHAHARLRATDWRDWHLLRLFCAGDPPAALVTPARTPGRRRSVAPPAESEFLDPAARQGRVAARAEFRGRRRLLQHALHALRQPEAGCVGLLLQGPEGAGKSSVAARLCDRLRGELQRVVVIGRLDEPSLIGAWVPDVPEPVREPLRAGPGELRFRLRAALVALADAGLPAPLFVLDGFERNQPGGADGDLALHPPAAHTLDALVEAIHRTGLGCVLVTGRFPLPPPYADVLPPFQLLPSDAAGES